MADDYPQNDPNSVQVLSLEDRQEHFDNAVLLMQRNFPIEDAGGQLYKHWEQCNRHLQDVLSLKDSFQLGRKNSKYFRASWPFCDLLTACQRYLYEINALTDLESVCAVNIDALATLEDGSRKDDLLAHCFSQQANLFESCGDVKRAIELNEKVYKIRLGEQPQKKNQLCFTSNNLAYCYNTANDHRTALGEFNKCLKWWEDFQSDQENPRAHHPVLLKNMARCLMYLGNEKEAERMLGVAMPLLRDEKPLNWAMLAHGYFVQGTLERRQQKLELAETSFIEAQNSWSKGDQARFHPFNAGCMFKIGACCLDQGKVEAAINHLRNSMEATNPRSKTFPVEHGRTLFKLSEALLQDNHDSSQQEAEILREQAGGFLRRRVPDTVRFDSEEVYDRLIPIFWR